MAHKKIIIMKRILAFIILCIGLTQTACNTGTQKSTVIDSSYTSDEQLEIARLAVYQEGDFTNVQKFVDGRAIVTFSDTIGLINLKGEITVLPEIKDLENFSNGFSAGHTRKGESCLVDATGKIVKTFPDYTSIGNFNKEGFAEFFHKNYKIGLMDKSFKEIIPAKYDLIHDFKNGILIAAVGEKWGAVDGNDKTVIPFEYIFLDAVDDQGLIRASKKSGEGFIDKTGKIIVPLTFARLFPFSENLAIFEGKDPGYFGLINSTGTVIVKPTYTEIREFKNGMSVVSTSVFDNEAAKSVTKNGYIDSTGKEVILPKYLGATDFSKEGFALVSDSTYNYFIDKLGNRMPLKFDPIGKDISVYVNGFSKIVTENSEVLRMDRFGRILKTDDIIKLRNSFFRK
jgi:hypothetical protein